MTRGLRVLAVVAALALGCGHAPPWEQPHGGWQAISSEHFVLYTDSWFPTYRYVLNRLEDSYAGLSRAFFGSLDLPTIEVLLLTEGEYDELLGLGTAGMFVEGTAAANGLLVLRRSHHRNVLDEVAAHELVHRFIAAKYPSMPRWLNEGIADYLSTLRVTDDEVEVGRLSATTEARGRRFLTSLRELAHAGDEMFHGKDADVRYHAATEFVRWLLHPRADGLESTRWTRLVAAYGTGAYQTDTADAIMTRVYPELTWAQLQTEVQRHIDTIESSSRYPIWTFPFHPPTRRPFQARPADRGYVKGLCGALRSARQ
jgi:hypothetical protein